MNGLPDRVRVDGLLWCADCHRAVDRGWPHAEGCSLAPAVAPTDEELRAVRRRIMDEFLERRVPPPPPPPEVCIEPATEYTS